MAVVSYGNRVVEVVALEGLEGVMVVEGKENAVCRPRCQQSSRTETR